MDVILVAAVLLLYIVYLALSFWAYKFRNIFYFLQRIENTYTYTYTMASMERPPARFPQGHPQDSKVESKRQRIRNVVAAGQSKILRKRNHFSHCWQGT